MASIVRKLQRQLKALVKFQDLLKAIKFVSGATLAALRGEINSRYDALQSISPLFSAEYIQDDYNTVLVVSITEDRGCCGPHNNNIIQETINLVSYLEDKNKDITLYSIGKKGVNAYKKLYPGYLKGYMLDFKDVRFNIDLCYLVVTKLYEYKCDRMFFVFNRFVSTQLQKVLAYEVTSFSDFLKSVMFRVNEKNKASTFFSTLLKKNLGFMENLYNFSVSLMLSDALSDNKYSFLAGRFSAMDLAVRNVATLIEQLTIVYNKARQEEITTDLNEIITCKEAISSESEVQTTLLSTNYTLKRIGRLVM